MKKLVIFCVFFLLFSIPSYAADISDGEIFNKVKNREWVYDTTIGGTPTNVIMYIGYDKDFDVTFASYGHSGNLLRTIAYSGRCTIQNGVIYLKSSWEGEARNKGQNGANDEVSRVEAVNFTYIFISCDGINLHLKDKFDGVEYIFR